MLQPNQPMGAPNMAATGPQAPKPQGSMPAGQMLSNVPPSGIASFLNNPQLDKVGNAYHGNPQALEQKGVNGDLLAALAAQRLKTKMAAAQRELEMAAGGQQPQDQKTVVQQNEDDLMEMTKQEMTREQAETLKQKQAQMQAGQKQLMQQAMAQAQPGLAGLPAPNAAEPRAMAAGGIIAFGGETDGSYVDPAKMGNTTYDPTDPYHRQDRIRSFREYFKDKYGYDPEEKGILTGIRTGIGSSLGSTSPEYLDLDKYEAMKSADQTAGAKPATRTVAESQPEGADEGGPQPGARKQQQARPADIRPAAPIQNAGIVPGGGGRNAALESALTTQLQQDPQKMAEQARGSAYEFMKPAEEDVASRRENLAGIQALNKKYFDPDQQQIRQLIRTLAVGPSSFAASTMGQMGRNAAAAGESEYRQQRAALLGEDKQLGDIMSDIYAPKKEAVGAGTQAGSQATQALSHAMSTAGNIRNAEIQAAVSAANNQAMAAERALTRETNDRTANLRIYENAQQNMDTALKNIDANYTKAAQALVVPGMKPSKEQQAQLLQLQMDRDNARTAIQDRYGPLVQQAAKKAGMDSGLATLSTDALKDYKITGSRPTK